MMLKLRVIHRLHISAWSTVTEWGKLCREAATDWGLQCKRYEIRDISPPSGVRAAMELQAEAERRKRAQVWRRPTLALPSPVSLACPTAVQSKPVHACKAGL